MASQNPKAQSRRAFATTFALSFAGVGAALVVWPLIDQMNPNPSTPAPDTATMDLLTVELGTSKSIAWHGMPIVARNRLREEIEIARQRSPHSLRDQYARNANLSKRAAAADENRTQKDYSQWLVVVGMCTRDACLLKDFDAEERLADGIGWFCPCCAARYDLSGRGLSGPGGVENLAIPPFEIQGWKLRVG